MRSFLFRFKCPWNSFLEANFKKCIYSDNGFAPNRQPNLTASLDHTCKCRHRYPSFQPHECHYRPWPHYRDPETRLTPYRAGAVDFVCLADISINWGTPRLHWVMDPLQFIMSSSDRWKYFAGHWQSPFLAHATAYHLLPGLCKEAVKVSTTVIACACVQTTSHDRQVWNRTIISHQIHFVFLPNPNIHFIFLLYFLWYLVIIASIQAVIFVDHSVILCWISERNINQLCTKYHLRQKIDRVCGFSIKKCCSDVPNVR